MIEPAQIVETPAQRVASIHITVPRDEIRQVMQPGLSELRAALEAQNIEPTGPWFTHHFEKPTDTFDFEICLPVAAEVRPSGRVRNGDLPAATVARTVYRGPYVGLPSAWGEFREWIAANGHTAAPDLWEVYVADNETELYQPLLR